MMGQLLRGSQTSFYGQIIVFRKVSLRPQNRWIAPALSPLPQDCATCMLCVLRVEFTEQQAT